METTSDHNLWTLEDALPLIRKIEEVCPRADCHVALTGGILYKEGPRKDLDIIFYRDRTKRIKGTKLLKILKKLDILVYKDYGWMLKAMYKGRRIDILFPESRSNGGYVSDNYEVIDLDSSIHQMEDI